MLPIFTTPFLMRTIGLENYGIIAFTKTLCFYFITLEDYGFNYSAASQISLCRQKPQQIQEIISTIFAIKSIFLLLSLSFLFLLTQWLPTLQNIQWPLLFYCPVMICHAFSPTFVFQGLDKMKGMTAMNMLCKFLFLLAMVTFIRSPEDYLYYPLLISIGAVVRLIIGLVLLKKLTKLHFYFPNLKQIQYQLKEGFTIFSSKIIINFYSRLPSLLLGFFCSHAMVGIYHSSIRIIRSTEGLVTPLTQALFPIASRKIKADKAQGAQYILQSIKYLAFIAFIVGVIYFIFAKQILLFFAGRILPQALVILRLHSFLPLIITLSNLVGIELLIPMGKKKAYSLTMAYTALLAFALLTILIPIYQATGAALAILISESFATFLMIHFFYKTKASLLIPS